MNTDGQTVLKVVRGIFRLLGIIIIIVGVVTFIGGVHDLFVYGGWYLEVEAVKSRVATTGLIISEEGGCGKRGGIVYSVQFTDKKGRSQVGYLSQCDSSIGDLSVGDKIAILYQPDNPNQVFLQSDYNQALNQSDYNQALDVVAGDAKEGLLYGLLGLGEMLLGLLLVGLFKIVGLFRKRWGSATAVSDM